MALAVGLILTAALATVIRQSRLRRLERDRVTQLSKLAEDKDRFLATVSHELRTPLTVVIGLAAELANSDDVNEDERRELLAMIEEHGQEAGAIVEDLLVAARSDIDRIAIRPEQIDPLEAIELAVSASPLEEVRVIGECPTIVADPARVQQILRNLLSNAARYGGPEVEIRVNCDGRMATIAVVDNGEPLSDAHQLAIFDPYMSAHDQGEHNGSIGLGLFISRKLARLMGGDLTYRHNGNGVLFKLSLPNDPVADPAAV
jgi:signal transduction histidine kinase